MNSLVVYDTAYGNTAKIAAVITAILSVKGFSKATHVEEVTDTDVRSADLIVIGSPTQAGKPTNSIQLFIESLSDQSLRTKHCAVFDTRYEPSAQTFPLRMLMRTIGFAASKMAKAAQKKGLQLVSEPMGFIVTDTKGPLGNEELDRAAVWAAHLSVSA